MAQDNVIGIFEGYQTVSANESWSKWNVFNKVKLPPFATMISYVTDPEMTSFNASNQWYGVWNQSFDHTPVAVGTTGTFPMAIVEKDNKLYLPENGYIDNSLFYGTEVNFLEGTPYIDMTGSMTATDPIIALTVEPPYGTFFYFLLDGAATDQSVLPYVNVIANDQEVKVGTVLYINNVATDIASVTPAKLSGISDINENGLFLQNSLDDAVDCLVAATSNQEAIVLVKIKDVGKLKWQIKTVG